MKYCDKCFSTYPSEFSICPKDHAELRATSELVPGMVLLGKYQVLEKIGVGGMAVVYKARHVAFQELRAIKLVSSRFMDDPEFLRRFQTEAVVTRKLQHPNAVRVDDLETTEDGRPFMVMEYVQGRNLRSVLQEGPLPVARALHIAKQVALALAAAHRLGIVHRDIKPDNILLVTQPDGADLAKVLDFGIARVREGSLHLGPGYTPTQTGMLVGTPQYISPEQAAGKHGDDVDGRADLYSLGVVLYEMLTGQAPFSSESAVELLMAHIHTVPTPPHYLKPDLNIPAPISLLLMKALEKDRNQRFQTAEEMVVALERPPHWATTAVLGSGALAALNATPPRPAANAGAPSPGAAVPAMAAAKLLAPAPARPAPAGPAAAAPARAPAPPQASGSKTWMWAAAALLVVALAAGAWVRHQGTVARAAAAQDARVLAEVQRVLAGNDRLRDDDLVVAVSHGVVQLSGRVNSPTEADLAESLARTVGGVDQVQSNLSVAPAPAPAPEAAPAAAGAGEIASPAAAPAAQTAPAADTSGNTAESGDISTEPSANAKAQQRREIRQLLQSGRQAMKNREPGIAMGYFQQVLALDPGNQWAELGMQHARTMLQKTQSARRSGR